MLTLQPQKTVNGCGNKPKQLSETNTVSETSQIVSVF